MEIKEIMSHVDHTLLTQTATWEEIRQSAMMRLLIRRRQSVFLQAL